jgi:hypothetical protein
VKLVFMILSFMLGFGHGLMAQDSIHVNNVIAETSITAYTPNETPVPSPFIAPSEFTYAGYERTTLMGTPPFRETAIKTTPFAVLTGTYVAAITALHIYQVNTIWDSTTSFRIIEDGDYGLYVDKLGHVWGGYMNAYILSEFLMGSGFSHDAATHWGAVMSLAYQSYVEILDGFGTGWGFSPSDMYSNALGISYFLGQHYVPFLQNFTPKANYIPPVWYGGKARDQSSSFIDDYSGYTFMLSANVNNLLPKEIDPYWPDWLNIGVGYTARNLTYKNGDMKYLIGLDINPAMILPDGGTEWNWFKQSLNYILLPLPMLELSPDGPPVFRLMYPFHFSIGSINF